MFNGNVKVQLSNNNVLEVPQNTTLLHVAKNIGSSFSKKKLPLETLTGN